MKRRIVLMLLVLSMVLSMAMGVSAAETGTQTPPALQLEVTQSKLGAVVSVYLQGCNGVTNGRFIVTFDADVLTLAEVQVSEASALSSVNDQEPGTVALAWVGSDLTAEKTLVVTLTLEAAQEITKDLTYSVTADGIYVDTEAVTVEGHTLTVPYTAAADTAALEQAIAQAEALNAADYTPGSYAVVQNALDAAIAVLADGDATQSEVDAAAKALTDAIAALKPAGSVDTAALEAKVANAKKLNAEEYTAESYAALTKAITAAEAVLAKADATQAEVDAALKALNEAIVALETPKTADESHLLETALMLTLSAAAIAALLVMIRSGKKKQACRFLAMALVVAMGLTMLPAGVLAADDIVTSTIKDAQGNAVGSVQQVSGSNRPNLKLDQDLSAQIARYDPDEMVRVIVELEGEGLLEQGYTQNQIADYGTVISGEIRKLEKIQNHMTTRIQAIVETSGLLPKGAATETKYNFTIALNGIAMTVPYGTLETIRELSGVKGAYVVSQYTSAVTETTSPAMYATSESFGSAQTWQELGYTGAGMKIAVIDSGLDVDHPSFEAAPANPSLSLADVESMLTELQAYALYSQTSAIKLTAEKLYYSEKIPFGFNYVDGSTDVTHDFDQQGDHGTHVAGICAANKMDTTEVVGVAPDAQLIPMKVFGQNGGAFGDDIMAAIEDCILLDVDVINMSLGAPAGFTEDSILVNEVYGRILETDMILAVAAGNVNSAATGNTLGTNLNYTSDPDNGMINSPATYLAATAVASLENTAMMMPYFKVGERKIAYVDVTYFNFASMAGTYEYVVIPGVGDVSDYAGLDMTGKIALVQRGTIDFVTKQFNASQAGAAALIVYDNVHGDLVSMYDGGYINNVFINKEDGEAMIAAAENGVGTMEIMPYGVETAIPSPVAGELSNFSCWGVTSDLQLSPDVTAPGGNIYSCYMDGAYGTMSGTSMACPHIAGMSALVLQHLHETYPNMTEEQYHVAAEALVMCTAVPVVDPDGILYSPRKQGAGSANVYSAVTSPVYLTSYQTATGELTPKASLGDDPDRTGIFTFTFEMHNMSTLEQSYSLAGVLLTDQFVEIDGKEYMGETGRNLTGKVTFETLDAEANLQYDANHDGRADLEDVQLVLDAANGLATLTSDVQKMMDIHFDGIINTVDAQMLYNLLLEGYVPQTQVTIPAGGSITVNVTIALSDEDKAYMEAHYPNGIYVDGFVRAYAQSEGAVDLSLPFVGFYGDWHDAPIYDTTWYYEDTENAEFNRYMHVIFATMGADPNNAGGLGINPYILEEYDPEHNVLSPNGDTYYDYVPDIYISLMRSAELLDFTWTDDASGEELFYEWYAYARKSYYWSAYGMCMPIVYSDGGLLPYTFYDENGQLMVEDLQHLTLTIRGYLDDGDLDDITSDEFGNPDPDPADADGVFEIPVVIDLQAPKIDVSSIIYTTEDGRNYITFRVADNYDIAAIVAMTNGGDAYEYIPVTTKVKGVNGESDTITLDITDYDSTFQLAICDYGCNETYYELTNPGYTGLAADQFYAFRRYSSPVYGDTVYMTDELNGWYSFESADNMFKHTSQPTSGEATVFAAEYIDGYIIGAQAGTDMASDANTLFIMKEGSWERTQLGHDRSLNFTVYEWPGRDETYFPLKMIALDMAYDYTTDTLYLLANGYANDYFPEGVENLLLKVDYLTGDVTLLGIIEPEEEEYFTALTLACDNDGVLYTVNYQNGKLYTIGKEPVAVTAKNGYGTYQAHCISTEDPSYYPAAYTQSMTVDHETNRLYWAAYQSKVGTAFFFEVDKQTGALISITAMEDNSEMTGLFKPYDSGKDIIPDATLEGIHFNAASVYMNVGQNTTLQIIAEPFNGALGEITWTSSNETVATVSPYGIVEATGIGTATVTATCGKFKTECTINVCAASGTLFAHSGENWLYMDAGQPFYSLAITDTMELDGEVKAAAHLQGYLYVAAVTTDYDDDFNEIYITNLYKLDPNTLSGKLIGSYEGGTTALAFNYADGFMYGLTTGYDPIRNCDVYDLIQVNIITAQSKVVASLNSIFNSEKKYETCSCALAIDQEGNFYVNGDHSVGNWNYENVLVKFRLSDSYAISNVTMFSGFSAYAKEGDAMVWSESNGGIIRATRDPETSEYILTWIDVTDMTNVQEISLGNIRGASYPGVFALAMPNSQEPDLPIVVPTSISLASSYTVPNGESVRVVPNMEPWNATASFYYEIADSTIASVDSNGNVTGLSVGKTTLTVIVPGTDLSATTTIIVEKNPGYLYGFFQADIAQQIPLEYWGRISIANPANSLPLTDIYDFTVYAAAYYDEFVYSCAQSSIDGLYYILKISPSNFTYEVLNVSRVMIRDMEFDYTTGTMYAIADDEVIDGGLYQVDLKTGAVTMVGDNDLGVALVAMAVDKSGAMVAADSNGKVYLVNKNTVELVDTGIEGDASRYLQAMAYDFNNDAIYWAKGGSIYQVDVANGKLVNVGVADVESGEMVSSGCVVSGLFSVPQVEIQMPETVAPTGVTMDQKNTVAVGETLALKAVVLPVSTAVVNRQLTWKSADETIATVDENGIVTGISAGVTYIYATDASGNTASVKITVTAEHRYFYGYDELSRSWVCFDFDGKIIATWTDTEGLSPIQAAHYIGETLYAYDEDGYFYEINTDTFQRTLLGNGIHGLTVDLEANDNANGYYYVEDCPYQVIDMTYAETENGIVAYAVIMAYSVSDWLDSYSYKVVEIDLATGEISRVIVADSLVDNEMSLRPTNLIYRDGYLYTVNGYITGMVTKIDIQTGALNGTAIFSEYWGDFNGGRGFIEDTLTGEVYAIRDKRTEYIGAPDYDDTKAQSVLCSISIGIAYAEAICTIGSNMRICGLFIK